MKVVKIIGGVTGFLTVVSTTGLAFLIPWTLGRKIVQLLITGILIIFCLNIFFGYGVKTISPWVNDIRIYYETQRQVQEQSELQKSNQRLKEYSSELQKSNQRLKEYSVAFEDALKKNVELINKNVYNIGVIGHLTRKLYQSDLYLDTHNDKKFIMNQYDQLEKDDILQKQEVQRSTVSRPGITVVELPNAPTGPREMLK